MKNLDMMMEETFSPLFPFRRWLFSGVNVVALMIMFCACAVSARCVSSPLSFLLARGVCFLVRRPQRFGHVVCCDAV